MKVAELNDLVIEIETRRDLIAIMEALTHDIASDPDGWEDTPLTPSWPLFSKLLLSAKYYE